jgi:hypothetical protein
MRELPGTCSSGKAQLQLVDREFGLVSMLIRLQRINQAWVEFSVEVDVQVSRRYMRCKEAESAGGSWAEVSEDVHKLRSK